MGKRSDTCDWLRQHLGCGLFPECPVASWTGATTAFTRMRVRCGPSLTMGRAQSVREPTILRNDSNLPAGACHGKVERDGGCETRRREGGNPPHFRGPVSASSTSPITPIPPNQIATNPKQSPPQGRIAAVGTCWWNEAGGGKSRSCWRGRKDRRAPADAPQQLCAVPAHHRPH